MQSISELKAYSFTQYVMHMLPNAHLQKHIGHTSYYEVPRSDVELATLFEQFEANKQRLGLDDWGISETSSVMMDYLADISFFFPPPPPLCCRWIGFSH